MSARNIEHEQNYLVYGLLASFAIHLLFIGFLRPHSNLVEVQPLVFEVAFEPPQALLKPRSDPQIVSDPDLINDTLPRETGFLSSQDSFAEREQIRRGDGGKTAPKPKTDPGSSSQAKSQQKPKDRQTQKNNEEIGLDPAKPLSIKKLDQATLLDSIKEEAPSVNTTSKTSLAHSSNSLDSALDLAPGSRDYIPNLPDGDITLLNTKAHRYASFVRRVATQVFGEIRAQGWQNLSYQDFAKISDAATINALMSLDGKLVKVVLTTTSGSQHFDEILELSVKKAADDKNPPKEAALADGYIHFIFQAKSWSKPVVSARSGVPIERRWLLLSTGLE